MYVVVEIQKNSEGQIATIVDSFDNRNAAESKYHTILSFAATSAIPSHAAVIMTEEGQTIMFQCYKHNEEVEEAE